MAAGLTDAAMPAGAAVPATAVTGLAVMSRAASVTVADRPAATLTDGDGRYGSTGAAPVPSEGGAAPGPLPQDVSGVLPRSNASVAPWLYWPLVR
jgi:hypothetical protein